MRSGRVRRRGGAVDEVLVTLDDAEAKALLDALHVLAMR